MAAWPFLVWLSFARRSRWNEMVMLMKTRHMLAAESMNIQRRRKRVTTSAMVTPLIKDQHWLAMLIRVLA